MKDTLIAIIRTLNGISVCGSENLNRLLGCIQALESMVADMSKPEGKENGRQEN